MSKSAIVTKVCSAVMHPEFVVEYESSIPQADIHVLASFLEESVKMGTRYLEGDLIAFGSMIFRVARCHDVLTLEEPNMESFPIHWDSGVTRSMRLTRLQKDIAESVGLVDEIDPPSIRSSLLVEASLMPKDEGLVLDRRNSIASDSGWFVGHRDSGPCCRDQVPTSRISIYQAILNWPKTCGFLGLPAGCRVEIGQGKLKLTRNGSPLEIKKDCLIDAVLKK